MIIALCGQKGGSGKTTTSTNIAGELHRKGHSVLLVDADPQGSSLTFGAVASEAGFEAPTVISMGEGLHQPDQLPKLAANFDYVVIDCPPRHGTIQRSALMICDLAIVPCGQSAVDAWALADTLELIEEARVFRPDLACKMLITRRVAGTALGRSARAYLEEAELETFDTELGFRVAYQEAPAAGQGVTSYAPSSTAAKEIKRLIKEIESLKVQQEVENVA